MPPAPPREARLLAGGGLPLAAVTGSGAVLMRQRVPGSSWPFPLVPWRHWLKLRGRDLPHGPIAANMAMRPVLPLPEQAT